MSEVTLALVSLLFGIVGSIVVSRYYFRESFKKSLTPYIQYYSSPFRDIDPEVKKSIAINYVGNPIDNLFEVHFLIANTGDKAIRDVIEPLTLLFPGDCILLDASIAHRHPEGTSVEVKRSEDSKKLSFPFKLLNSGDFFIVKILLDGSPKLQDLAFSIVVDELPPMLKPQRLSLDAIVTQKKKHKIDFGPLIFGVVMIVIAFALARLVYDAWHGVPALTFSMGGVWLFLTQLNVSSVATLLAIIPTIAIGTLGGLLIVISWSESFSFPRPKHRFSIPDNLHKQRMPPFLALDDD
jgi:hypothetical protein